MTSSAFSRSIGTMRRADLQRIEREGGAADPVDVELVHQIRHAVQIRRRPGDDQQVARRIRLHDAAGRRERIEDALQFAGADIVQRQDADGVAGLQRVLR
jgi:LPS O-antigen subunit length determinant protein (WzzB/FepE family)